MSELLTLSDAVLSTGRSASTLRRLVRSGQLTIQPRQSDRDPLLFSTDDLAGAGLSVQAQTSADAGRAEVLAQQVATLTAERDAARSETEQVRGELGAEITRLTADLALAEQALAERRSAYGELAQALAVQAQSVALASQQVELTERVATPRRWRWFTK